MKKHLFGMALFACLVMISGAASAQTIDDIQFYNAGTGVPEPGNPNGGGTDLMGAIVTVTGTVVELHQYSSGSAHIIDSTGQGIAIYHGSNPFPAVLGDEIEITGTVAGTAAASLAGVGVPAATRSCPGRSRSSHQARQPPVLRPDPFSGR